MNIAIRDILVKGVIAFRYIYFAGNVKLALASRNECKYNPAHLCEI